MTDAANNDVHKGWGTQKSREITWHDPAPTTSMGASMAGLDFMLAIMDGQVPPPPLQSLMQINMVSVEPGKVVFTCAPDESTYNLTGVVHGGVICALLDNAVGAAVRSTLPQGKGNTSVEIKVNYLKAVQQSSGLLTATGTVVKSGSRVAFTEGTVTDVSGALVATASSTVLVFDLPNRARTQPTTRRNQLSALFSMRRGGPRPARVS
jgi:uncharacterized protein (TIGR00369 family)